HGELGRASVNGQDRLITEHQDEKGIELREHTLDVHAESALPGRVGTLKAVGWSEDVQALSARIHYPPGWSLLAVQGADQAPGTWVAAWDLWGIFFVLVVSLAIGR